jgi:hypothetical protein
MLRFQRRSGQALFPSNSDANSHAAATGPSHADSAEYHREPGWNSAHADSDRESEVHRRSGPGSRDPDSDTNAEERRTRTQHADTNAADQDS